MRSGVFSPLTKYRGLTLAFTKRDILGRYRGASLGVLWSLLTPLLMLIVYTLAFGFILKSRWPGYSGGALEFSLILFVGLIVHGAFAECLTRAPSILVQNSNLVTKVVFPLPVLSWMVVSTATFHLLANLVVFIVLSIVIRGFVPWTAVLLPAVWLPLAILCVAVVTTLSAVGVYLRDASQLVAAVAAAMLFLSSAIIPVDALPESYRIIFYLNPLTFIIDQSREVAYFGNFPNWLGLACYAVVALFALILAHVFFVKTEKGFADVL